MDVASEAREVYREYSRPPEDATAAIYEYLLEQVDERIGWGISLGTLAFMAKLKIPEAAERLAETKIDATLQFRVTTKTANKWAGDSLKKIEGRAKKIAKGLGKKALTRRDLDGPTMLELGRAVGERATAAAQAFSEADLVERILIHPNTIYFASGSNLPGEMYGFARLGATAGHRLQFGIAVEVCLGKNLNHPLRERLDTECMLGVLSLARKHRHTRIFVDSGAFSEVDAQKNGPPKLNKKKEIKAKSRKVDGETVLGWEDRLASYELIAKAYGPRAFLVAPDLVANQKATLARMRDKKNHAAIMRCFQLGANILAPIQRGKMSTEAFYSEVRKIYRAIDKAGKLIPALPMKKGATSLEELRQLLDDVKHPIGAMHLLGVGPGGSIPRWANRKGGEAGSDEVIEAIRSHPRHGRMLILHDSVLVKRAVGRGFLGLSPEVYTLAQDVVYREIMPEAYYESRWGKRSIKGWVKGKGWGRDKITDYANNLDSKEARKWISAYQRQRFLWHVKRETRRAKPKTKSMREAERLARRGELPLDYEFGPEGWQVDSGPSVAHGIWEIDQWREGPGGKPMGLTKAERDLVLKDPGAFFRSEVMPWNSMYRGLTWAHPELFGPWLDLEWAHYLAAERSARKKRDGILRAWSIEDPSARADRLERVAPSANDAANAATTLALSK
jgi:hypothetical protein